MGPGHQHLGPAAAAAHLHHVDADGIALFEDFAVDLLGTGEQRVSLVSAGADANGHVIGGGLDAQHRAGENLMLLGGEALKDHAPLGLANALDDDLLGSLGGDAAKGLGLHIHIHQVAQLSMGVDAAGGVQRDLRRRSDDVVHHFFLHIHMHSVFIALDEHVVGISILVFLIRGHQCLGDLFHHIGLGNAPLLLQLRQSSKNLLVHIVPIPPLF